MYDISAKLKYARSKAVSDSLAGPAWLVYDSYKIERRDGEVFIYAPFRTPLCEAGRVYHGPPEDVGLKRHYAPLRDYPNLFLRFAAISRKDLLTEDEMLEEVLAWATSYGVLGLDGIDYLEVPGRRDYRMGRRESLSVFSEEVLNAAEVLELYETSTVPGGPDNSLTAALRKWDHTTEGQTLRDQKEFALLVVADRVGSYVSRECYPILYRTIRNDSGTVGFVQGLGFHSLLGAMYLQMMWLMIEGSAENVRRCKRPGCSQIISFEPPEEPEDSTRRGARGKYRTRKDKEYCSNKCKQWVYDEAKRQASH